MKLDLTKWKEFTLCSIFDIRMGDKLDKNKMSQDSPSVNFVSRISYNNGVDGRVDRLDNLEPNCAGQLTVSLGGEYLGSCFIQKEPFYTAQNVAILSPKFQEMTHNVLVFISTLIKFECRTKYYAFGRELNTHINKDFTVRLPVQVDANGDVITDDSLLCSKEGFIPDWQYMDRFIKSLKSKPITTKNKPRSCSQLLTNSWRYFNITKLFDVERGSLGSLKEIEVGDTPIVSASGENEGIAFWGNVDAPYENHITISMNGVNTGFTAYHGYPFNCNADCCVLKQKFTLNKYIGLFLVTVIQQLHDKYSYGRKMSAERIGKESIKLPIQHNQDGTPIIDESRVFSSHGFVPDWDYMEDFIKSLPYGDRL